MLQVIRAAMLVLPLSCCKAASAFSHLSFSSSLIVFRVWRCPSSSHVFVCMIFAKPAYDFGGFIFYLKGTSIWEGLIFILLGRPTEERKHGRNFTFWGGLSNSFW